MYLLRCSQRSSSVHSQASSVPDTVGTDDAMDSDPVRPTARRRSHLRVPSSTPDPTDEELALEDETDGGSERSMDWAASKVSAHVARRRLQRKEEELEAMEYVPDEEPSESAGEEQSLPAVIEAFPIQPYTYFARGRGLPFLGQMVLVDADDIEFNHSLDPIDTPWDMCANPVDGTTE
jgi:hypothetical protein